MLKGLFTMIAMIFTMQLFGQYYPSVTKDFITIDKNNVVYTPGKAFTYSVNITKNGQPIYLEQNDSLNFTLVEKEPKNRLNEFTMVVLKAKPFKRHTLRQTDIAYVFNNDFTADIERSTLVENEQNTWLQLPTYGFFQLLHQAGAPYIKTPLVLGQDWHDRNMIEDDFGNETWGTWEYTLSLSHDYQITNKIEIETPNFGTVECYEVKADTKSRIGAQQMTAYYSPEYGFIAMNYSFTSGYTVNISLKEIQIYDTKKPISNIEQLKEYYNQRKQAIKESIILE